jgi:hypothetical protein
MNLASKLSAAPVAPAVRRRAQDVVVETGPVLALASHEAAWRALFVEAVEPNPFLGSDFLLPLARLRGGRIHAAVAWRQAGSGRAMAGLIAYVPTPGLPFWHPPLLRALPDSYVSNATPLLAAGGVSATAAGLAAGLAAAHPGAVLVLDALRLEGPVASAFTAAGGASLTTGVHARAALRAGEPSAAHLARGSSEKLRGLRRREKRLAEAGRVETRTLWGAAAAEAVDAFLALEAQGWKGRQRTALASRPADLAFARAALSGTAPSIAADLMTVDGRPVAAAVHLVAGEEAAAFKAAYDETWSKASPGVLLDLHTLRMTLDSGRLALMDSATAPGHPLEELWRDRLAFGRVLVAPQADATREDLEAVARRLEAMEKATRRAKAVVKRALGRKSTALRA